jgi:hypothetical protein
MYISIVIKPITNGSSTITGVTVDGKGIIQAIFHSAAGLNQK